MVCAERRIAHALCSNLVSPPLALSRHSPRLNRPRVIFLTCAVTAPASRRDALSSHLAFPITDSHVMSIKLNETFQVNAPADMVWLFLKDPAQVVTCLPGAELTETIDAQTYGGRVKVKVGPITAAYSGRATLTQVDDVAHRMQIVGEGKESGGAGSARMTLTGIVSSLPDGSSEVSVDASIDIAGRVMQFGRGLIESVNKQLFRQFAESVQRKLAAAYAAHQEAPMPAVPAVSFTAPETLHANDSQPAAHCSAERPSVATARIARGEELRALPLLWRAFMSWLRGVFRSKR